LGRSDVLVDLTDILPTLADLASATIPDGHAVDGQSFAPLLLGENFEGREWIFSYLGEARFLRDKHWLLDGLNNFWYCGDHRDESGYVNVTYDTSPEVVAAKQQFVEWLEDLPKPTEDEIEEMLPTGPARGQSTLTFSRIVNSPPAPWPPVME